jgi:hypothetical protein
MGRYNMFFTKQDAEVMDAKIKKISDDNNLNLDMKKVKGQSGDSTHVLLSILQRQYPEGGKQ